MLAYRALLRLYPASWRAEYGDEMRAAFAARRRGVSSLLEWLGLWLDVIPDLVTNAAAVHWDVLRQDLRYAARTLRRTPGFAAAAIAIGALGIGATTAAFTMAGHVLVRPFPYRAPDGLVRFNMARTQGTWDVVSPADFRDWSRMTTTFESMAAYSGSSVDLSGLGEPQRIDGASVTAGLFPALGVQPLAGRTFTPQDDREDAPGTVVLSYGLWQNEFGGDPAVIGRTVNLDNTAYTIIGVMPRSFYFPSRSERMWTAMRWGPRDYQERLNTYVVVIGRMKEGIGLEQAQAEMRTIGNRLARQYPQDLAGTTVNAVRMRDDVSRRSVLMLKVLMGAAVCVLLIACANLANLLLARAMVRRRELAVRTALGAGRERLVRQMLTESVLLSLAGGGLGCLLAYAAMPVLARLVPVTLPLAEVPPIDPRVMAAATLMMCATGTGFGLIPALRARRRQIATELRDGGRGGTGRSQRLRSALVIFEVAASVVLLVGFGLLTRALWRVQSVDPGFRPDHVLTLRTSLPMPRYESPEKREPFYRHVLAETRRLPGVTAAAYISFLPMVMRGGIWQVGIPGRPEDRARQDMASLRFTTADFFSVMGIPLLLGRDVANTDLHNSPAVAVVSASFVKRYWPDANPLGRHIEVGNQDRVVVGVVGDVKVRGLERTSEPQVYCPWQQTDRVSPWYAPKDLVVRAAGDPMALAPALRRIIHEADAEQPVSEVRPLAEIVAGETEPRRVQLSVLGAFGLAAFVLAAVGIHSLLAFVVSQRTQEIGVRMALGAGAGDILAMTLREGFRLAAVGIAAGVPAAYAAGSLLSSLLAGVAPHDGVTFAAAMTVAFVMTLAGSLAPALRAVRVDPTTAIRAE